MSDPLQQHGDQLVILLPTQLQLLKHRYRQRVKFNNWRITFSEVNGRPDVILLHRISKAADLLTLSYKTHPFYIFSFKRDYNLNFFIKLEGL